MLKRKIQTIVGRLLELDDRFLAAVSLLWRRRARILHILAAAERLVVAVNSAERQDLEDIHALDKQVWHAMLGTVFAVFPPEKQVEPNSEDDADTDILNVISWD